MNIFKNFIKAIINTKKIQKEEIEFYPLARRYYPKINGSYLRRSYPSMNIYLTDIYYAEHFNNERDAWRLIEEYNEMKYKTKVQIIKRVNNK